MTTEAIIRELKALGPAERSKVRAFLDESDDCIPESFRRGMEQALAGKLVDMEKVMSGAEPPKREL